MNDTIAMHILDGFHIAQDEYYSKNGKVSTKLSNLAFPESQNTKLREMGDNNVIKRDSLSKMDEGEQGYFRYVYWTDVDRQKSFILMISDPSLHVSNSWLYLDYQNKEGNLVIGSRPEIYDESRITSNLKEFMDTYSQNCRMERKFSLN